MKKITLTLLTLLFVITPFIKNIKGQELPDYYVEIDNEVYITPVEKMFSSTLSFSPITILYTYDRNNDTYYFNGLTFDITLDYVNADPQYDHYQNYNLNYSYRNTKNTKYMAIEITEIDGGLGEYIISIDFYNDIMDTISVDSIIIDTEYLIIDNFYNERIWLRSSKVPYRYEDIISDNFNVGYDKGYQDGTLNGKEIGNQEGYDLGYDNGYQEGYDLGASTDYNFANLLLAVFSSFGVFLSFEILPGITLGAIISVPLVFGILFFILGKKGE